MHDENSVSLKVYLMEGNNSVEVRRFEVDQGVITNYDYVRERLQMAIPRLRDTQYKLLWQDADGDEVTISSDEELMIALSEFKSNVCKFIARLPTPAGEEIQTNIIIPNIPELLSTFSSFANSCPLFSEQSGELQCHSCQKPISGMRYKCLECVEYYHCSECESKNLHPDHVMLRLSKSPSLTALIPKCMQILKCHLIRGSKCAGMSANSYFREKMSHGHAEKDKCGGHHRRKFRRHGHHGGDSKNTSGTEETMPECPFGAGQFSNVGSMISTFLGLYKDIVHKNTETENPSSSAAGPSKPSTSDSPIKTVNLDAGPAMPTTLDDDKMQEDSVEPSQSSNDAQKDSKINMALELLAEMGFNDENRWLSRLLEHFDGDIAKTIDHLTLGK